VLDLKTVITYFLALFAIRFDPRNITNPLVDLLSCEQPVQSAFKKALTKSGFDLAHNLSSHISRILLNVIYNEPK
jgi:hypothetical protein